MMMVMVSAGMSCMLVVVAGVIFFLFKDQLFGGTGPIPIVAINGPGGGPTGGDGQAPPGTSTAKWVCPGDRVWGAGAMRGKCCVPGKDTTDAANCGFTPLKVDKVILYQDVNYGGKATPYNVPGEYKTTPGNISSLRIPPNTEVEIFYESNFKGDYSLKLTDDKPNLDSLYSEYRGRNVSWNDDIESMKVRRKTAT